MFTFKMTFTLDDNLKCQHQLVRKSNKTTVRKTVSDGDMYICCPELLFANAENSTNLQKTFTRKMSLKNPFLNLKKVFLWASSPPPPPAM